MNTPVFRIQNHMTLGARLNHEPSFGAWSSGPLSAGLAPRDTSRLLSQPNSQAKKLVVLTALLCVDQRTCGPAITIAITKKQTQRRKCAVGRRKSKLADKPSSRMTSTTFASDALKTPK